MTNNEKAIILMNAIERAHKNGYVYFVLWNKMTDDTKQFNCKHLIKTKRENEILLDARFMNAFFGKGWQNKVEIFLQLHEQNGNIFQALDDFMKTNQQKQLTT